MQRDMTPAPQPEPLPMLPQRMFHDGVADTVYTPTTSFRTQAPFRIDMVDK